MASWREWENHFDKIPPVKLKGHIAALNRLLKDSLIAKEYEDLKSLRNIMKGSLLYRKK